MKSLISKKNIGLIGAATIFFLTVIIMPSTVSANYDYGNRDYQNNRPISIARMYSSALPFSQHTYPAPQPVPVPTPVYYPVYQPVYQQPVYQNLQVSCYANISSAYTGSQVIWNASVSGGNGSYSYSWTGTDGLYGYNSSSVSKYYYTSGYKYATVTVTSGSQSVTQSCSNGIQIYDIQYYYGGNQQTYNYAYPVTYNNTQDQNNLDIGCFADPMNSTVNQPVTWSAEVTGGIAPYTYSWSGSDGLNGSGSSVTKYYSTNGEKSAIVTITSADGKTGTHACSNQLAVRNVSNTYAYVAPIKSSNSGSQTQSQTNQNGQTQTQTNNQDGSQTQATAQNGAQAQTASALFSLNNVPWGWVAMLVILVLFATVLYMLFNRQKI